MNTDFYELLGVSRDAQAQEIKKAYRNLARQYHPDANPGDPEAEEMFKAISVAYEVLSDPQKRAQYDQYGVDGLRQGAGFGGGAQNGTFDFNLNDLFESFFGSAGFGGGGFSGGASSGTFDSQVQVDVTLSEACFGVTKTVDLTMDRTCQECDGSGAKPGSTPRTCDTCNGQGAVQEIRQTLFGQMMASSTCPTCSGYGTTITDPCDKCSSTGVTAQDVAMEITIPGGVDTGSRLRLSGQGPSGMRGARPGDLYVIINVQPDKRFERHGDDLVAVQEISILQAIFGASVDFPTLEDTQTLTIGPGTKSGEIFRLRNHGMHKLRGRGRGDLLVYVNVVIPSAKDLTEEQQEILKTYAASIGEEISEPHHHTGLFEKVKRAFT
jgi:molecular chaperone DnaJ